MLLRLPAMLLLCFACAVSASAGTAPPQIATRPDIRQVAQALGIGPDRVIGFARDRLNGDEMPRTLVITCRTVEQGHPLGGEIVVLAPAPDRASVPLRVLWRHRNLNPWKLAIADVDGDGQREIAVGVWKKSPKDPVMAKRTFFYTWNGRRLLPKWLGSRLSRRFDDFALGDINGDGWDELVSLEVAPKGRHRIAAYRWHSFGFEWLGCTAELPGLARLDTVRGRVVASGERCRVAVTCHRGRVVLAE